MTEKPEGLLCALVAEVAGDPPTQSVVDHCTGCGLAVWRALSSPIKVPAICQYCVMARMQLTGRCARFMPPTRKQRTDIEETRKRRER